MNNPLAIAVGALFVLLALWHFYMAARGPGAQESAAVPSVGGKPLFQPSKKATIAVGVVLLLFALLVAATGGMLSPRVPESLLVFLSCALALGLAARAVGDFRYVGFFKRVRDTRFARMDTLVYSPLCLLLALGVAGVAFFSDEIRGRQAFNQVCEREAGLKVYEPLQPGVGWGVPEAQAEAAALPLTFEQVPFVRFRNEKDEKVYDIVRSPAIKTADPGYAVVPVDPSRSVLYRFDRQWVDLPGDAPISMLRFSVTNVKSEALAASYTHFSYGAASDPANAKDCQDDVPVRDARTGMLLPSRFRASLASAFAK